MFQQPVFMEDLSVPTRENFWEMDIILENMTIFFQLFALVSWYARCELQAAIEYRHCTFAETSKYHLFIRSLIINSSMSS